MFDINVALEILRSYGFTSTNHPYIYNKGDVIGICYSYYDENYGPLERVKFFDGKDEFEDFVKRFKWIKDNGLKTNSRIALDNYETVEPQVMFLRNNKVMVRGEMFNLEEFDQIEAKKPDMDLSSRLIFEAGNLLLVYDEIKNAQLDYLKDIVSLKNILRNKYFELQKEIDQYNDVSIDREIKFLSDVVDTSSIDENTERIIKDKYNQYRVGVPSVEIAASLVNDVWGLIMGLENNYRYYELQIEENDIRNELRIVNLKLDAIMSLNDKVGALFKKDLLQIFNKIDRTNKNLMVSIPKDYIQNKLRDIEKKYSYLNNISVYHLADYLKEALHNTNYADLALRYPKDSLDVIKNDKLPMNEVAVNLFNQYKSNLSVEEQNILILYNSKYRFYFDNIMSIKNYVSLPIKKIVKKLNSIKGSSKIKSICFDLVKDRINSEVNNNIKLSVLKDINYDSYDNFVNSLVILCNKLREIKNKLILNSDIKMYYYSPNGYYIYNEYMRMVTNNLKDIIDNINNVKKDRIGLVLIKKDTPILYSPYYLDIGDEYSKDDNTPMSVKEMINFDLLINIEDVNINSESDNVKVARYYSDPLLDGDIYIVSDIMLKDILTYIRLTINKKEG